MHPADIEGAIGGIQALGQTNVRAGVEAAYQALQATEARQKHVILLTDGWSYSGDISPLAREDGRPGGHAQRGSGRRRLGRIPGRPGAERRWAVLCRDRTFWPCPTFS